MSVSYNKLKTLVEDNKLELVLVVAPPRTNSTMIEHSLGMSGDVDGKIHEPFISAREREFDAELVYAKILKYVLEFLEENEGARVRVVLKEMAQWLARDKEYERLLKLTNVSVIFLIRNPLLSVESRLRKVIEAVNKKKRLRVQRWLLDEIAEEHDFSNWAELLNEKEKNGYSARHLTFIGDIEAASRLYDVSTTTAQNKLLDFRAQMRGYTNWDHLVDRKLRVDRDYNYFGSYMKTRSARVCLEKIEFSSLLEQVNYCERSQIPYIVIDTSDVRAMPAQYISAICEKVEIDYDQKMINWGSAEVEFKTDQTEESEMIWYDTIQGSAKINAPGEISPVYSIFPEVVRHYLIKVNLPIYGKLTRKKLQVDCDIAELNSIVCTIDTSYKSIPKFRRHDEFQGMTLGVAHKLQMVEIDPIYALTNDPSLYETHGFRQKTKNTHAKLKSLKSL